MYGKLYEKIMKVDFKEAEKIFIKISNEEQKQIIEEMAYDTESIIVYVFLQYMNEKDEKVVFHEIEFNILTSALCHIEGAYQVAFLHNQRLLELVPDSVRYLEWMLSFYDVKVIDKEKTLGIISKILEKDSDNKLAKDMLKRIS